MDGAIQSAIAFLTMSLKAGAEAAEVENMADKQIENLRIVFAGTSADTSVGARALELLADQEVFTANQKKDLARAHPGRHHSWLHPRNARLQKTNERVRVQLRDRSSLDCAFRQDNG